ncbi:hypothetical protein CK203_079174 [Vitis vinifera]|uniref:Retrovirus-related Pol polyprotein from transposon TNT 1-94-like beta-barrel domain-containing protein n=1 Tax=Vitis vinifera TaxID=29760 RepID=A0A438DYS5_VITVI|nr:hypothetical protein CK203_079174 [Vitis vinifera]
MVFSTPQGPPGGDLQFSQSTGARKPSTAPATRVFRPATASHAPAREPLSGDALPPPGSPDADQPPFLPVSAIRALHVPLLGVLLPFRSMTKYGMASSQVSSVTSPESGGRSEIPNLGGSDSSPILITGHKLNGHNYLQWSQSVLLFICGKGKDEYLTGEAAMPETTEPGLQRTSGMQPKKLTQVLKILQNFFSNNRKIVEQKRLFKFFLGLNRELDDVRGRIMGIKPLPTLREAFSEVRREESRKKVMMGSKEQPAQHWMPLPLLLGHLIVVVEIVRNGIGLSVIIPRSDRDGRAHVVANSESTSVPELSPFNKEQMEMLQKLLSQVGSGSTTGIALTANRGGMKPWIVDTSASNHMIGDAAILQNYKPSNGHSSVHIADGSKSKIVGTGLEIGKMIGSVELCSGLYLLSCGQFSNKVSQASCVQSQKSPNPSQFAPTELSIPMPSSVQPAQHTNVPSPVTIQSPMPIQPIAPQLANENLQVYIRRRKRQELEHGSQSTCG